METLQEKRVPGHRAERLLENVLRFRRAWGRYHRPDDVNRLLGLFRRVSLPRGMVLDYLRFGTREEGWIWPFVRPEGRRIRPEPPPALAAIPVDLLVTKRGDSPDLRPVVKETLYDHLTYERTPEGLFEYAFFARELWALKSSPARHEWLALEPLFTRWRFDAAARKGTGQLRRGIRPKHFDPVVRLDPRGGGEVRFLVHAPAPWRRILYLHLLVDPEGFVTMREGDLVATLRG